jgi:hypothetical protein
LAEAARDRAHDVVAAHARSVVLHLLLQIAHIQPGEARRGDPVALPVHAVTRKTGIGGPAVAAAQRNQLPRRRQGRTRIIGDRMTGRDGRQADDREQISRVVERAHEASNGG